MGEVAVPSKGSAGSQGVKILCCPWYCFICFRVIGALSFVLFHNPRHNPNPRSNPNPNPRPNPNRDVEVTRG